MQHFAHSSGLTIRLLNLTIFIKGIFVEPPVPQMPGFFILMLIKKQEGHNWASLQIT